MREYRTKQMRNLFFWLILSGVTVLFLRGAEMADCQPNKVGETAPAFSLQAMDGKVYDTSQATGYSVTILCFFSTSCGPCEQILRNLIEIFQEYQHFGLNVWAVTSSTKADVEQMLRGSTLPFPVLFDQSHTADAYQANFVFPTTYLIDSGKRIIFSYQGGGMTAQVLIKRIVQKRAAELLKVEDQFLQYKKIGVEAFNGKQYQLACDSLNKALAIRPDRDCQLYLSYSLIVLNQPQKAEATIKSGIEAYPYDSRFYQIYVRYLLARDATRKALEVLDTGLKANPEDVNLKYLREYVEDIASGKRQKTSQ